MIKENRLYNQFLIYLDILSDGYPHIEIFFAAMKIAEKIYPDMAQDLRSMCLFHLIYNEDGSMDIFNLYLGDYDSFRQLMLECKLYDTSIKGHLESHDYMEKIDFDINSTEDHLTLQTEYYVDNYRVTDKLTDIMLLFNPTDSFAYYIKGVVFSVSNFTLSEKYLKRASTLETSPGMNQITCRVLGDLYLKNNLPEKATQQYMKCYQFGEVSDLVENGLKIANDMIANK